LPDPDETVEQLRLSRRRLALAADADRRRIERELHDGPQQDLVALAVNLQRARQLVETDPAAARALLDELRRDVQEALEGARELAHRIYPPLLAEGGLAAALRHAAARARVEVPVGSALPPELAGAVYFCCIDALGVMKPEAIAVREEEGTLVFEIAGVAADQELTAIRDRVEALGGTLTVEPGRVTGSLPRVR
jgi:signal transduction histidine kinase